MFRGWKLVLGNSDGGEVRKLASMESSTAVLCTLIFIQTFKCLMAAFYSQPLAPSVHPDLSQAPGTQREKRQLGVPALRKHNIVLLLRLFYFSPYLYLNISWEKAD